MRCAAEGAANFRERVTAAFLALLAMAGLGGCGSADVRADVTLTPKTAVVFAGQTVSFRQSGADQATFSVDEGPAGGTVGPNGAYTAPDTPGVFHVRAQAKGDSSKFAVARVSVVGAIQAPSTVTLGGSANASVGDPGGLMYAWTASGGTLDGAANGSAVQVSSVSAVFLTLAISARDDKNANASSSVTIPAFPVPQIVTQDFLLAGRSGASAQVTNPEPRYTYRWNVSGGSIPGDSTGAAIGYSAGAAGTLTVSCSPVNPDGGVGPATSLSVPVGSDGLQRFAGPAGGGGNTDGMGTDARFNLPTKLAGNGENGGPVYVADESNCLLRMLVRSAAGWSVTTVTGDPVECIDADGPGKLARVNTPRAVATDSAGNLYLATSTAIRKMTPDGTFLPFAGPYGTTNGESDGVGTGARFSNEISALAVDSHDNVWVVDRNAIRQISPLGVVTTVAGQQNVSGHQDGPAASATFDHPDGIAVDPSGNVYVSQDSDMVVRQIDSSGMVSTYAGQLGTPGFADGPRLDAGFSYPRGLRIDASGALLVSDCNGIRRITQDGQVATLYRAGPMVEGSSGACSTDVMTGPDGGFLLADGSKDWIGATVPDGGLELVAGSGTRNGFVDGPGVGALTSPVSSLAVDPASGLVYFLADGEAGIRTFDPAAGEVKTWLADVGSGPDGFLRKLARHPSGTLYVLDGTRHVIWKVGPDGTSSVLAGTSGESGYQDGQGAAARFNFPGGIAVDAQGNVFVGDTHNRAIRKIDPDGKVTTLVGQPGASLPADGPPSTARLDFPNGMVLDATGTLYFCDGPRIRSAAPDGTVTTLLGGLISAPGHVDGEGGAASFYAYDCGLALDPAGNLLLAESGTGLVRRLTRSGQTWKVTTILGTAGPSRVATGSLHTASLSRPRAIGLLPGGDLVLGDNNESSLLVARTCPASGACGCSTDAECPRGSGCQAGSCQVTSWTHHFGLSTGLKIPSTPDLLPGSDFTVEMWIQLDYAALINGSIWRKWADGMEDKHLHWAASSEPGMQTQLLFAAFAGVGNPYPFLYAAPPAARTWHHVAVSNDGTTERIFVDGHVAASMPVGPFPLRDADGPLFFGRFFDDFGGNTSFSLAEARISGADRYAGDFVPPATLTADAKTRALWHLDAGVGTSVPDISGHGHDGTLVGPLGWVPTDAL